MSFFIRSKSGQAPFSKNKGVKGKRGQSDAGKNEAVPKRKRKAFDDEIQSDSDSEGEAAKPTVPRDSSDEEEEETAQEKRLRLTKQYLAQIEAEAAEQASDEELDKDLVAQRLKEDALEQAGKLHKEIASQYLPPTAADITVLRGHQLSVTCAVISHDKKYIYSASKDSSIVKWCAKEEKKVKTIPGGRKGTEEQHIGHTTHIMCMAISSDSKFLVTGDMNKMIYVWNPATMERLHILKGHRGGVTSLSFRRGSHQLFSGSEDKTVKVWNLDEMAYVETLFGHTDTVQAVDSLNRERAITSGGRDNSVRIWKIVEESQLVFLGHGASIDCISLINEEHFISGADDNSISLWSVMKKKPLVKVTRAHCGVDNNSTADRQNWISAVCSHTHTDLVASGSKDGCIKLWKVAPNFRELILLHTIPVAGFVNSLSFSADGSVLVAGIGQEHKMGRWWRIKEAKNGICIIRLKRNQEEQARTTKTAGKQ